MAISTILPSLETFGGAQPAFITLTSIILGLCTLYLYVRPALVRPKGSPPLLKEDWPIIGTFRFFSGRWDFFQQARASHGGAPFSFFVGQNHVVALTGEEGRKAFFETRELDLQEGYVFSMIIAFGSMDADCGIYRFGTLLAGSPSAQVKEEVEDAKMRGEEDPNWNNHFMKRISGLLKGDTMRKGAPYSEHTYRCMRDMLMARCRPAKNDI